MTTVLDVTKQPSVQYAIPIWLRDLQILQAIGRVKDRIEAYPGTRPDPIAVVCYGPSLNDTWEQVKNYPFIITCSGAHKFLLERGIVPTWDVEVDPRAHKVELLGPPHPDVEYLIASTCHAKVFDHLDGHRVKLWHVFDSTDEAQRVLPKEEWAITGGSSAGLRALTMARFLGFTNLHVFGMDGCEGASGKHAGPHPNQPQDHNLTVYNGIEYRTTPSMLLCAQQTWHELNQMPDVTATFYGDGLVQAMATDYVRQPPMSANFVAFKQSATISAEYTALNAKLHHDNLLYGAGGEKHAPIVLKLAKQLNTTSVLDYGCGKSLLAKALPWPIWEYDPAIPGKDTPPRPADIVVCTDVLEHVEPERLTFTLVELRRVTRRVGYFVIHTGPASKTLADGRNAHLIQEGAAWWRHQLQAYFEVGKIQQSGPLLHVVVGPKKKAKRSV